jgi:NTP pyrophosphatase (non-canonical NTP hydrolase)
MFYSFGVSERAISLAEVQESIRATFGGKDGARGIDGTFMWFMEEVGELSAALRAGSASDRAGEFADVLAWLATLANISGIDLSSAFLAKYGDACPGCRRRPCACGTEEKP